MAANNTTRLFVAVFPPTEVARRLAEAASAMARGLSPKAVAWTRLEQIHLTLNFLGNVESAKLDDVQRVVEAACRHGERHVLRAHGIGCFPSPARPRIVWAGIGEAVAILEELKRTLDESLGSLGYAPDMRPFHPHLTIGRIKLLNGGDRRHLAATLPAWSEVDFGSWTVERIDLMRSALAPAGAKYALIQSFTLPGAIVRV
jgi:RNA 2',3'-cyclic 3'-phosphodiesterase